MTDDKPLDWKHWNACDVLTVQEAIALSLGRNPDTNRQERLVHGRLTRVFGGEPEFSKRLDLLRRAIDLRSSQFVPPSDIYGAFKPLEDRYVLPDKVRLFLVTKGFAVPSEWTAGSLARSTADSDESNEEWVGYARKICNEIRTTRRKRNLDQIADEIHERFQKERITTRRGDVPEPSYIRRWALQNLPKP